MHNAPLPVSLIVPCLNESRIIAEFIEHIKVEQFQEVIIVDGGSADETEEIVATYPVEWYTTGLARRSVQMNYGAKQAKAEYLLFLHADVRPGLDFYAQLSKSIEQSLSCANFRLRFDLSHWFLKFNAFFTRFTFLPFQFGDQGLLIRKEVFDLERFNEDMVLLEDQELLRRLRKSGHLCKKINSTLSVSARAYRRTGVIKMQFIYYLIYIAYRLGLSQPKLFRLYRRLLT